MTKLQKELRDLTSNNVLVEFRRILLLTQKELARIAGVTPICIYFYEKGKRTPGFTSGRHIIEYAKSKGFRITPQQLGMKLYNDNNG